MITAKNYAAQVESACTKNIVPIFSQRNLNSEVAAINELSNFIKNSVHFCMPDDFKIMNDNLKGIRGVDIRLPYQSITVEFFMNDSEHPKRLVLAIERPSGSKFKIFTYGFCFSNNEWMPSKLGWLLCSEWDNLSGIEFDHNGNRVTSDMVSELKGSDYFAGEPINFIEAWGDTCKTKDEFAGHARMAAYEALAVLELLEALSCKNVEQSTYQPASPKNAQRIKSHKLPIYETKFLTIKASECKAEGKSGFLGSHASPRQHLRRGHIRRLESGNIWVNSCVVGDSSKGVIEKQYKIH